MAVALVVAVVVVVVPIESDDLLLLSSVANLSFLLPDLSFLLFVVVDDDFHSRVLVHQKSKAKEERSSLI